MLDHLKETCEEALQHAVNERTVQTILELAERHNAFQLRDVCEHFIRYHGSIPAITLGDELDSLHLSNE